MDVSMVHLVQSCLGGAYLPGCVAGARALSVAICSLQGFGNGSAYGLIQSADYEGARLPMKISRKQSDDPQISGRAKNIACH